MPLLSVEFALFLSRFPADLLGLGEIPVRPKPAAFWLPV